MARKKTTSAKKRNKKPAVATAGAATTGIASASPAVPTTAGGDRMNELFVDNGKHINFERVVKYMPKTAQQLKEGTLSLQQFTEDVSAAFEKQFRGSACSLREMDPIFCNIIGACWPGPGDSAAATEFFQKFGESMNDAFFEQYDAFKDLPDEAFCEAAIVVLQWSLEKICRTFSAQLDRECFNGKTGAFLRWCPLYGVSSAKEFADTMRTWTLMPNLTEELTRARKKLRVFGRVKRDAFLAGSALADRADEAWGQCWECGKSAKDCPFCSSCSVARYCGRECQVKAWGQHKTTCARNKKLHGVFLENLRMVEETHKSGTMHGVKLNFTHDGEIALSIMNIGFRPRYYNLPADGPR